MIGRPVRSVFSLCLHILKKREDSEPPLAILDFFFLQICLIEDFPIYKKVRNIKTANKVLFFCMTLIILIKSKKKSILDNKEEIVEEIVKIVEEKINFKEIMLEKMGNFSLKEIEDIILRVSKEELKHIEIIGGILGAVIAIFQFLLMLVINKI